MQRISRAFFTLAVLCGMSGMIWGMHMGASQDFAAAPAHAHLNLVGWVSLAVMGTYYSLDPAAVSKLAWVNFILSGLGAIILPTGIGLIAMGHEAQGGLFAMIGGSFAFLGMLTFLIAVLGGWRRAGNA